MSDVIDQRSAESAAFETVYRSLYSGAGLPLRSAIDLGLFRRFARFMAIAEPMEREQKIILRLAGSGFFEFFGFDLTHADYLNFIENEALRDKALASACLMSTHRCGLWQLTPLSSNAGETFEVEFTAFPIVDARTNAAQLVLFVHHGFTDATGYPRALHVNAARAWTWINLGNGVPA